MFIIHPDNLAILSQDGDIKVTTTRSLLSPTEPAHQLTLGEMLKKSTKRDASLFSTFKDGKFWDDWHRSTIATANAQDIEDTLNPDYSPASPKDI